MKTIATLTAALMLGVSAPALAQTTTTSVAVSYADLNLRSKAGVETLNRRLTRAVNQICGENSPDFDEWRDIKRCRAEARQSIAPQLAKAYHKYGVDDARLADAR